MSKTKNTVLFRMLFIFAFVYVSKNLDLRVTRRFFISLKIAWILVFCEGGLDSTNAKDNLIILGAHPFKPLISRQNWNNPKFNKPALGETTQNIGKGVSSGVNKPPRALSDFWTPHKSVSGATVGGIGLSSLRSPVYESNLFNTKSSNQSQTPTYFNQPSKKKKKGYEVDISEDRFIQLPTNL